MKDSRKSYKKLHSHKGRLYSSKISRMLRHPLFAAIVASILFFGVFFVEFPQTEYEVEDFPFNTIYKEDASLEIGESRVEQEGANGEITTTYQSSSSLFDRLFRKNSIAKHESSSGITTQPVEKIVIEGTKKYQYMWCSDGTYRYYTDDEFNRPSVGFTHKGKDYCAENGQGMMTRLANIPSPPRSYNEYNYYDSEPEEDYYRSGAICSDGTYSNATGRGACSWHGGVSEWLY